MLQAFPDYDFSLHQIDRHFRKYYGKFGEMWAVLSIDLRTFECD